MTTTCATSNIGPVCTQSGTIWSCYTESGAVATQGAEIYVVYDDAGDRCTADSYCAFGEDSYGEPFCCDLPLPGATITEIHVTGQDGIYADTMAFHYTDGSSVYHELDAGGGTPLDAVCNALDGNDDIEGSSSTNALYWENLRGGFGNDTIHAWAGDDSLIGSGGNDFCYAGAGDDYVGLGFGDDSGWGEPGIDVMYGEGGIHYMDGGLGADLVVGGVGADVLCGGAVNAGDTLRGGDDDDELWLVGPSGAEVGGAPVGGSPSDSCSTNGGASLGCETTLTTKPSFCP